MYDRQYLLHKFSDISEFWYNFLRWVNESRNIFKLQKKVIRITRVNKVFATWIKTTVLHVSLQASLSFII